MGSQQNYLEAENEELVTKLSDKVKTLKHLSIDIGNEVKQQNGFLDTLGSDFDSTGSLLGSAMRKIGVIASAGGHRFICYLVAFAFCVFLVIWYLVK